jgi:Fe-S cluster biogenesis protein NfuA
MTAGEERTTPAQSRGDADSAAAERLDDVAARELVERLESLLARLEMLPDQLARTMALDAVESLVRLYGEGLARIVEQIDGAGDPALVSAIAHDEVVAHLLLLHGLHPESLEERVRRALDDVRPYLHSHAADVELLEITGELARVRITSTGQGGAPSGKAVRVAVETAVLRAAPELERVEVEGAATHAQPLVAIEGPRRSAPLRGAPQAETSEPREPLQQSAP